MNQLTYREKLTAEMTWGAIPVDTDFIRNSSLFKEGLKKFDNGEWKYFEKEVWKDVPKYEGFYQGSTHGRIRSVDRMVNKSLKEGDLRLAKGKIINPVLGNHGYYYINLCKDGKCTPTTIHTIIASLFLESIEGMTQVNHKNKVRTDNHYTNLELVNYRENNTHQQNKEKKSSKYVGVSWSKSSEKWRAGIKIKGKSYNLGDYTSEEDAYEAYKEALKERGLTNRYAN